MSNSKKIETYLKKNERWYPALSKIRNLLLKTELEEKVKWGMPVYCINNKNVVGLSGFQKHFGLWFYQGVFLKDKHKILVNAQEGKTKAMRHMRFYKPDEFDIKLIKEYISEAIQNAKDGKEIKPQKVTIPVPKILADKLSSDKNLNDKFNKFTPGRKKEFYDFIGSAKREATQLSRLQKSIEMINRGETPMDKYKKK